MTTTIILPFPMHISFLPLLLILSATAHSQLPPSPPTLSPADLSALRAIRATLRDAPGAPTNFFSTWDFTAPDPCNSFSGVTCSLDPFSPYTLRVSTLTLGTGRSDSPGLLGSLSNSIAFLTKLTQLVLFPGRVSGIIPSEIGFLSNLRVVSLTSNDLTGLIPDTFSQLKNLHTLDLSDNRLTGFIPHSVMNLPLLKVLILSSNHISGELPPLPTTTDLLHLDLRNNKISGTLKPSRTSYSIPLSLRYLSLSNNVMWGPLDNGLFESLSNLVFIDLSMNRFTGPLPPSVFLPSSQLFLQRNFFNGQLPKTIPTLTGSTESSIVDLSHNMLSGTIPEALAGVETLYLNNNRFSGSVPERYVESVYGGTMKTLYLQHNYISEFPVELGMALPYSASLCVSYNCMVPLAALTVSCPASAGSQIFRPVAQCDVFNNGTTGHG